MIAALATSAVAAPPNAIRLDRGRFTVIHYAGDRTLAEAVLSSAVARDSFPGLPRGTARLVIMIAPDVATFNEWVGATARPSIAAVAIAEQNRVVMRGRGAPPNSDDPLQVLRHELAHIALNEYLGVRAPRWFDEGYASYAAGEERTEGFLATNVTLVFRRMPTLAGLDTLLTSRKESEMNAGYALALRAVTDLASIDRTRGLEPLLVAMKERASFDLAARRAFAITAADFERQWQRRTRWTFAILAVATDSAVFGALLLLPLVPLYRSKRRAQRARLDAMRARETTAELELRQRAVDSVVRSLEPEARPAEGDA
jgi:uncharacterized MnhB-related membrane protein